MDHDVVVREKMTEKYLLNELDPKARDEFEEHFFDCRDCALDVRATAEFVEHSKVVLAEQDTANDTARDQGRVFVPVPRPAWFGWWRPLVTAPVMVLLLAVVGYQNLVTLPQMAKTLNNPQVLPWTSVNIGTYGAEARTITVPTGSGFLLFVRIPPDGNYVSYKADLYNPAGKLEWSLTIPAAESQDQWPVQVPAANRQAGTYALVVHGTTAAGESREVGRTSFELQLR